MTSSSLRDPDEDVWVKELLRDRYGYEIGTFVGPSPSLFVNCTFDGNLVRIEPLLEACFFEGMSFAIPFRLPRAAI